METTTLPLRNLMNRSPLRAFLLILLVLACFALSPQARAACQEGCLTNQNTVLGDDALLNKTGSNNTAFGFNALYSNTSGFNNTANGVYALYSNTTGNGNTAYGAAALYSNTTGNRNTATGDAALYLSTGSDNIGLGHYAGFSLSTGHNNIDIGNVGLASDSGRIRIGTSGTQTATFIAGINGAAIGAGVPVRVSISGQLGTQASSARFKEAIKPMDKSSEALLALKPVTFHYKHELDPDGVPQFGLVAEDVEKVNPDLVARDEQGKPCTVRYEAVNAMLLNEFLKEHRKVEKQEKTIAQQDRKVQEQGATITQLKKEMKTVVARLEEQTAQIQKVSAQLEVNKTASQIVLNNQ
jgi:Chaperone of endosialidase